MQRRQLKALRRLVRSCPSIATAPSLDPLPTTVDSAGHANAVKSKKKGPASGPTPLSIGRLGRVKADPTPLVVEIPAEGRQRPVVHRLRRPEVNNPNIRYREPGESVAEALSRAKELATDLGFHVEIGWPVFWWKDLCFIFVPREGDPLQIEKPSPPTWLIREGALSEFLGGSNKYGRVSHFGDVPRELMKVVDDQG